MCYASPPGFFSRTDMQSRFASRGDKKNRDEDNLVLVGVESQSTLSISKTGSNPPIMIEMQLRVIQLWTGAGELQGHCPSVEIILLASPKRGAIRPPVFHANGFVTELTKLDELGARNILVCLLLSPRIPLTPTNRVLDHRRHGALDGRARPDSNTI